MKKTLIASAIAMTSIGATNANANMAVTQMNFSGLSAASGSVNDDGTLGQFTGSFFGHTWVADQVTGILVEGDTWSGSNALGAWDYTTELANLFNGTQAVGALFDWSTSSDIPVLAVFDCTSVPGTCTGVTNSPNGSAMQTGPFVGSTPAFNGTGSLTPATVPVPAAVWLMGSGLLGLVGVARRRKVA